MAFTFDANDIRMTSTGLEFGGDYNVKVTSADFKGKTKMVTTTQQYDLKS
ncbi:Uncharacterised protein [Weissella viridescens]|uniref:Uncharacterized protein n=1 Tax=Weissella viridescens TaxID=1629 RepID=A0A380PA27_WEIVI|nr:Uncharacterised protein [Weissella viridescens]